MSSLVENQQSTSTPPNSLTIEGDTVRYVTPEGQEHKLSLAELLDLAMPRHMDTLGVVLPQGVRMAYSEGRRTVWVCEIAPSVRALPWITPDSPAPFGGGAKYSMRRIALPYLIVLAVFEGDMLSNWNEAFFRTAPLESENDELFYPALLNCSRFDPPDGHPLAWICTQKLDRGPLKHERDSAKRMRLGLRLLAECLLHAGFNYSSDHHEASSWFTESQKVDQRISTIEQWERASQEAPLFILEVPFLPTGLSVVQVVERIMQNQRIGRPVTTADDLARLIVHHQAAPRRRPR